jgi:Na+/proline symporter
MNSVLWRVLAAISAIAAGRAADATLTLLWRGATGEKPPTVPEDPETSWGEALAWGALSGAVMGIARMLATRQAAQYYVKSTGSLPKALIRD